ncbi:hypothetical protein VOI54_16545 [Tamlana sp. 2201CG12-4]|uniref:hypothetical protein n=1 Tax=Tamlana sp. 2201CG12-4 TaxID=3112582 RepID=UPI002DBF5C57|nr:hypothetical protein [Tamlana sp. 2201CG12-4]MEC3908639.1 hypothetical protein [Tamlana sp. 2201CG12-4]
MKKFIIGLFILGLTNLMYSQNYSIEYRMSDIIPVNYKEDIKNNLGYLRSSENYNMAKRAIKLKEIVANFNIQELDIYKPLSASSKVSFLYEVVFKEGANKIIATYNQKGQIIHAQEEFYNMPIPRQVSIALSKKFPGWAYTRTSCKVNYSKNSDLQISYKIQLKNGKTLKNLKIDSKGNLI